MKKGELEAAYREVALRRSRDYDAGHITSANRAFDELHNLKNQMRTLLADRGEAILKRFARHPDVELRISACADLLAIDEPFAINALQEIEETEPGLASVTAKYTISEWKAGKLKEYLE